MQPTHSPPKRAVLLDRDGTIIANRHYLADPSGVSLLPAAAAGLQRLQRLGLPLVMVSNQSGIGRGMFDASAVERVNERMCELLAVDGIGLDGLYYCPHAPEAACACRKPRRGLVERAARDLAFDPGRSFVIGDSAVDVGLARAVGACAFLIADRGDGPADDSVGEPDYVVENLVQAAEIVARLL